MRYSGSILILILLLLSLPVRAEVQLTPVILQFQSDGSHTISGEVPSGAILSGASSCTSAEVLKRYPDMALSQNKVASCANIHEEIDMLVYAKNIADTAIDALNQRIEAQKISLAELNKLKYNDTFPSITISPSGYEADVDIPGISDIAPQCVSISNKSQLAFVGKRNPIFASTPSLESVSLVYLNLYKQYQDLIQSWTSAKDQKTKTKVEDALGTFIDGNKAIAMVNTDAGLSKIDTLSRQAINKYSLHVSGAYNATASCGLGGFLPGKVKFQAYDIYVDNFMKTKCLPFDIAKGMVISQINGKIQELTVLRDRFVGISAQKKIAIDKITSNNRECIEGKSTAQTEIQMSTKNTPLLKPASSDSVNITPTVIQNKTTPIVTPSPLITPASYTPTPFHTPIYYPITTYTPTPTPSYSPLPSPTQSISPSYSPVSSTTASPTASPSSTISPTVSSTITPSGSPVSEAHSKSLFASVLYSIADFLDSL